MLDLSVFQAIVKCSLPGTKKMEWKAAAAASKESQEQKNNSRDKTKEEQRSGSSTETTKKDSSGTDSFVHPKKKVPNAKSQGKPKGRGEGADYAVSPNKDYRSAVLVYDT